MCFSLTKKKFSIFCLILNLSVSLLSRDLLPRMKSFYIIPISPSSHSPQLEFWRLLVALFVVYNVVTVPARLGFRLLWNSDHPAVLSLRVIDYMSDLVFILDIYFCFRTVYHEHGFVLFLHAFC